MGTKKLSSLRIGQSFKFAAIHNVVIYKGYDHITRQYEYQYIDSDNLLGTVNDENVFV